jgi:metal-responsive CopG/Arc/MetJ family transcriptional regulator
MRFTISVSDDIAADVDQLAAELHESRSAIYALAAAQFVARHSERKAQLDKVYGPPVLPPPTPFRRQMAKNIRKARGGHAW